jgi:hypothetical protein
VHPYRNRFRRIAAIGVILLRIPTKGRRHVARGEKRVTARQAGSKSDTGQREPASWGRLIIRRHFLAAFVELRL